MLNSISNQAVSFKEWIPVNGVGGEKFINTHPISSGAPTIITNWNSNTGIMNGDRKLLAEVKETPDDMAQKFQAADKAYAEQEKTVVLTNAHDYLHNETKRFQIEGHNFKS
jgi:hypothetical protein